MSPATIKNGTKIPAIFAGEERGDTISPAFGPAEEVAVSETSQEQLVLLGRCPRNFVCVSTNSLVPQSAADLLFIPESVGTKDLQHLLSITIQNTGKLYSPTAQTGRTNITGPSPKRRDRTTVTPLPRGSRAAPSGPGNSEQSKPCLAVHAAPKVLLRQASCADDSGPACTRSVPHDVLNAAIVTLASQHARWRSKRRPLAHREAPPAKRRPSEAIR